MTTPRSITEPPTTLGAQATAIARSHGRSDYRRGEAYKPMAAESWRQGWIEEAHLAQRGRLAPNLALAMAGAAALDALDAARRVLRQCTVSRPTRQQAAMMSEAAPLIDDALARLRPAAEPPTDEPADAG